jgi:hypothetical protein
MFRLLMFVGILCLVIPEGLSAQTSDRSQALGQRVAALEFEIEGLAQGSLVPVGLHSNTVSPVGELLGRTEMWFVRSEGNPVAQAGASTKSPALAAGLSLVLPLVLVNGIGSYYAGNSGHGTRHLLIGFGSFGVMVAGLGSCFDAFSNCSAEWAIALGGGAYLANWVWGAVTAGLDAGAYNRRQSETRAARFEPRFEVLTASTLSTSAAPERHRLGLQLVRLAF